MPASITTKVTLLERRLLDAVKVPDRLGRSLHASTRVTATMCAGVVADGTRETLTRRLADAGYGS
jgi:hypothetical protein